MITINISRETKASIDPMVDNTFHIVMASG
jgi:hypothetical protein